MFLCVCFLKMYNLKPQLNERVKRFIEQSSERTKKQCGDLGEFIINMFLSDYSYSTNEALKRALVAELFARQIYWIEKNEQVVLERIGSSDQLLQKAFAGSKTSNHLFVFNIEMAKFFIDGHQHKMQVLDKRFGILPDNVVDSFQARIVEIKNISTYCSLMSAIGYASYISSSKAMVDFLLNSKKLAIKQGYIRTNV